MLIAVSARDTRSYGHFCMLAKALELKGCRPVAAVFSGSDLPRRYFESFALTRFVELDDYLPEGDVPALEFEPELEFRGIPVGQYVLSTASRILHAPSVDPDEAAPLLGELVETTVRSSLAPALDALLLWGMHHLTEPPRPDEPIHPEHALRGLTLLLQSEGVDVGSVRWKVRLPGTDNFVLTGDRGRWELRIEQESEATADVTITATRSGLIRFLTAPLSRNVDADDVEITGTPAAIRTFLEAIEMFPPDSAASAPLRSERSEAAWQGQR